MTSSRPPMPLGLTSLEKALLTPGPLGHNDYASPDPQYASLGDSSGPLGINDHAAPFCDAKSSGDAPSAGQDKIAEVMIPTSAKADRLKEDDFGAAANALGADVSVAIIKAFAEVESGGKSGFGPDGLPLIAYEGHVFRRLTKKRHDASYPLLSYRYTTKAGPEWHQNNRNHGASWKTLRSAMGLDFDAALQSCSWGMFQVMGFNYKACGFNDVSGFVNAMKAGERGQLLAFIGFCKSRSGLRRAMAEVDFQRMALIYNGEDYGNYDKLIERSFKRHSRQ